MTLKRDFRFLEVAYPYVARRLLTDEDPALRERLLQVRALAACALRPAAAPPARPSPSPAPSPPHTHPAPPPCASSTPQVLFQDGKFQWKRLENLIALAREGGGSSGLDLSDTVKDALRVRGCWRGCWSLLAAGAARAGCQGRGAGCQGRGAGHLHARASGGPAAPH
jgi:hypothetical protein